MSALFHPVLLVLVALIKSNAWRLSLLSRSHMILMYQSWELPDIASHFDAEMHSITRCLAPASPSEPSLISASGPSQLEDHPQSPAVPQIVITMTDQSLHTQASLPLTDFWHDAHSWQLCASAGL